MIMGGGGEGVEGGGLSTERFIKIYYPQTLH
jgi:hypothetical protein